MAHWHIKHLKLSIENGPTDRPMNLLKEALFWSLKRAGTKNITMFLAVKNYNRLV